MSRFDTRTCQIDGWDNQLPVCEGTEKVKYTIGFSWKNNIWFPKRPFSEQFLK